MTMWFHQTSAARLLRRRIGAVLRMTSVAMMGSLWIAVGVVWVLGMMRETDTIAATVRMHALLREGTGIDTVRIIEKAIGHMPAVQHAQRRRGTDAVQSFLRELHVNDSGLATVVSMNDAVIVTPRRDYCTTEGMRLLQRTITLAYPEVDHVVWPEDLVHAIERRQTDLIALGGAAGIMSVILFLLALSYAFRAEIHRADSDLQIGSLMGAGPFFIAMPHILVGIVATLVGTGLSALVAWSAWSPTLAVLPWLGTIQPAEIAITIATTAALGCTLSAWQSVRAAQRATRRS